MKIPFTVCMSTQTEKPSPLTDSLFQFTDSHTVTHKLSRAHQDQYLYLSIKSELACVLKATATVTLVYNNTATNSPKKHTNQSIIQNATAASRMYATVSSLNSLAKTQVNSKLKGQEEAQKSHLRKKRSKKSKAILDMLHKKDIEHENLCELKGYEGSLAEKLVRKRAINDRIEAINQSSILKEKFEKEYAELKKKKLEKHKVQIKSKGNFMKANAKLSANWTDEQMNRAIARNLAYKVAHNNVLHKKKANEYRKEVRGLIRLNAQQLKTLQIDLAQKNLEDLKAEHKRTHKFNVIIKLYQSLATLKTRYDDIIAKHRHQCKLEQYASVIQRRFMFLSYL